MAHRHLGLMQVHYLACQKHVALTVEHCNWMAWSHLGVADKDQWHLGLVDLHYLSLEDLHLMAWANLRLDGMALGVVHVGHVNYLSCQKHLALTVTHCNCMASSHLRVAGKVQRHLDLMHLPKHQAAFASAHGGHMFGAPKPLAPPHHLSPWHLFRLIP